MIEGLTTPAGRIVWGKPGRPTIQTDRATKQPKIGKDGKPVEQWAFGLAIPKAEFLAKIWPYLDQEAKTAYPSGVPQNFSWKFKDGDGVDSNGKPYNLREGHAGCYILTVSSTAFAPPMYKFENGAYRQIGPEEIKCGDYVAVNMNVKVNVPQDRTFTPGLYVNPNGVQFVGYGAEIFNSANPDEMFGSQPIALPQGASAVPLASSAPMPGTAGAAPAGMPQGYPAAQPAPYQPAAQAAAMPPPAHDFVHGAGQPAVAGYPPAGNGYAPQGMPVNTAPAGMPGYGVPTNNGPIAPQNAYPSNGMPGAIPGR